MLQNLESTQGAEITKADIVKALKEVAIQNHAAVDVAKLTETAEELLCSSDSYSAGTIQRAALREALTQQAAELHSLTSPDPVHHQILSQLEGLDTVKITKRELGSAILRVCKANDQALSKSQTSALVETIYKSADSEFNGNITRSKLKDAIIANIDKVSVVTAEGTAGTSVGPIVSQVMRILDAVDSGSILKNEFQKAVVEVAYLNKIQLDVAALTESVYQRSSNLQRQSIRLALNQS